MHLGDGSLSTSVGSHTCWPRLARDDRWLVVYGIVVSLLYRFAELAKVRQ